MLHRRSLAIFLIACLHATSAQAAPVASDFPKSESVESEKLVPKRAPTEDEEARQEANILFAAARMMGQKENYPAALRMYQRALRCDPQAAPIAREIVPLAFTLGRSAVAVRYAVKAAELDPTDAALMQRLAVHLTTEGDFERAVSLYEKALAARKKTKPDADDILLATQIAKLYVVTENNPKAAEFYRRVMEALASDDQSILDSRTRRVIVEDSNKTMEIMGATLGGRSPDAAAFDLFGLVMLQGGDAEGAKRAFEKAREMSPVEALDAYQQAQLLAHEQKWDEARKSLDVYLQASVDARGAAPYDLLKSILAGQGREQDFVAELEKFRSPDKPNATFDAYLADLYRQTGDWEKARPLYEKSLADKPSLSAYRGLIEVHRQTKQADKLLDVVVKALGDAGAFELLGKEGEALLADPETTAALVKLASDRVASGDKPYSRDELTSLGQLALEAKNPEAADNFFNRALAAAGADKYQIFRRWGLGLLLTDQFAESARVFRRTLDEAKTEENEAELQFHLAGALEMNDQTDEALAAARRAVELVEPKADKLGAMYYRIAARPAWVLYHAKRFDEAGKAYRELLDRFDSDHESEELRQTLRDARLMLSNIAVMSHDMPHAEEWLEQILDEFPDDISAHNDLGYLWADQNKKLGRAHAMIEKAVAEEPQNGAYLDSLGWVLYRLGRFDDAVRQLEAAVNLESDPDGVMLDHLGDAYLAAGQADKARETWKRAAEALERSGDADKLKAVREKIAQHEPTARVPSGKRARAA